MAKKLTYDELSKKLFSMEEELRTKEDTWYILSINYIKSWRSS